MGFFEFFNSIFIDGKPEKSVWLKYSIADISLHSIRFLSFRVINVIPSVEMSTLYEKDSFRNMKKIKIEKGISSDIANRIGPFAEFGL